MTEREGLVTEEILLRIQAEYLELPGLRLTFAQARRLWDLDPKTCEAALTMLIERGFLQRTPSGHYARRHPEHGTREAA